MKRFLIALFCGAIGLAGSPARADQPAGERRLPTGARLDPAVPSVDLGNFPLAVALAPEGKRAAVLLCGYRQQGLQIVDLDSGTVLQTIPQKAAFVGVAFSPDGRTLFASGGNEDLVYRYAWRNGEAVADGAIALGPQPKKPGGGTVYPAGLAVSADGRWLYVAENLGDALSVVDLAAGRVVQRFATQRYPYAVVASPAGDVYVSSWGGTRVSHFRQSSGGFLVHVGAVDVGRHPSALLLNRTGMRLFVTLASVDRVAVVDVRRDRVVAVLDDAPPGGTREGSTPNALALSPEGDRLWVAEGDNNAVAVFDLSPRTAGVPSKHLSDRLAGRIPTDWYPTALASRAGEMLVVSGKGRGTGPNPGLQPNRSVSDASTDYTLGQTHGTLAGIATSVSAGQLAAYSKRVGAANHWTPRRGGAAYPPFRHVIYVIKENRTYDQVFGDVAAGDGDPALLYFPREVSPNHRALAERFGLFDRFLVNAEVSADGHSWSTAAYATDYTEKTLPATYSRRGRSYDYEGSNRERFPERDEDDVAAPAAGYLWNAAIRKGISFRDYGEYVVQSKDVPANPPFTGFRSPKQALQPYFCVDFPGFDLSVSDQRRADVWVGEFRQFVEHGSLPALQIVRLPNDHTNGAAAGKPTPRAYFADNDLALGRIVEALSESPFWKDTVVFVVEDDAQSGPDHVDSHRSVLLVISAWNQPGTVHRFVNTTDVIATMEDILGLESLSQFDRFGRPLRGIFAEKPDLRPYRHLVPAQSLDEKNPAGTKQAAATATLDLSRADAADDEVLNRILWEAIKGDAVPYPAPAALHGAGR